MQKGETTWTTIPPPQQPNKIKLFFLDVLRDLFECLYDDGVISEDALWTWEKSEDPAEVEGRGVAIISTVHFFNWLSTAEDEDEDLNRIPAAQIVS